MTQTLPSHARAVVVGGGIVGSSVAYHLTKLGWTDVLLLERKESIGGIKARLTEHPFSAPPPPPSCPFLVPPVQPAPRHDAHEADERSPVEVGLRLTLACAASADP